MHYEQSDLQSLIKSIKSYNPNTDVDEITRAYGYMVRAHEGQFRNSGEPYAIHPMAVAKILASLNMDDATIIAGLFHDVVEDTEITYEDLEYLFSKEIADLVDGVTKLKQIKFKTKKDNQAENLKKMILAMAKDIRVIIIKLSDRLHNMRTLEYMTREKQIEKANEVLEIYAPLAHRLGMSTIKWELEDLSLKYLEPNIYQDIVNKINETRQQRESQIQNIIRQFQDELEKYNIKAEIFGRPKSVFSIYKKMYKKHLAFEEIKDLSAIRVIVNKESECYDVLGIAHRFFRPIPNTFKDYIATPKPNMYQSLHTTILAHDGRTYEIQIRTWEMHKTSEYGIAAHWKYKEGTTNKKSKYDSKLAWLREIMDWQKDYTDSKEFMDLFKEEFANDEVFVYSPKGDVMDLPSGSTPIDFAYKVHSAVGNKCVGAKVDGKIVPLTYKLKTGNVVEILTNPNSGPSKDWLKIVKSSQAKTKIKQWFKKEQRTENIVSGRDMLEKEVAKMGFSFNELLKREWLEEIASKLSFSSIDDLYAAIGYGSTRVTQVIPKLKEYHKDYYETDQVVNKPNHVDFVNEEPKESGVVIDGIDNVEIKLAKCCNPIPGDEIVGYITRGRGISVHRRDCSNVKSVDDKDRLITVRWGNNLINHNYQVELQIISFSNVGYLADITKVISECKLNIKTFNTRTNKDKTVMINIILEISSSSQIDTVIARIKNIKGTIDVFRVNS